ncbi:putative Triacylglycerol lipase [Cucumis melo var. makuwa]|uniref:Putative Triacylglycerol lipase n=1 Tax=Cucumis melo var. makuwa TaxID=1194695 RepID=A0A5D3C7F4_CUCMM|nr:putative Triacylglycerol lipase [Cucumis melo var. makuwa]
MATTQLKNGDDFRYLVVRPEKGGIRDVFRCWVWPDGDGGRRFFESSEEGVFDAKVSGSRWIIVVSVLIRKVIAILGKPLEWTGNVVEFTLNLLSMNANLLGLLCNIVRGEVVVPRRGTETFISTVGLLDGRMDLLNEEKLLKGTTDFVSEERGLGLEMGNRYLVDLCVMASKLSYENEKVIQNIVLRYWKMHFVGFYNCWNDFQKDNCTQVFILCNKPKDANLILISFRGTEPFDADDWSTDFDYSWYEIPEVGKIHIGFLEALGLGNRNDTNSFNGHLQAKTSISSIASDVSHGSTSPFGHTKSTISNLDQNIEHFDEVTPEVEQLTAYYTVKLQLRRLLMEHRNAKFVVTGHSLGGALAILFPTVLVLHKEMEIMGRLLGVYTFGQPRVGNKQLGQFMEPYLVNPIPRYFRVVYCNDIVPRLPYDNKAFLFKHFGVCLYYDSLFIEHKVDEEPNKNFLGIRYLIPEYLNALWELLRSLLMGYTHGPEYKEGWFCILAWKEEPIPLKIPTIVHLARQGQANSVPPRAIASSN